MRSLLTFGILSFALTFCGLGDRIKQMTGSGSSNSATGTNTSTGSSSANSGGTVEKATLTGPQKEILDSSAEIKWDDQGISWKVPGGWSKMDVKKETFNYRSADNAFLLVNISAMPDSFPMDVSLKAYYEQALGQLKTGKYESVKLVEVDGVQGVEFTEAAPEEKDGIRRHQWIAYRTYLGQKQMVNVMTSTSASKFGKHSDEFQAILYSTTFVK